MNKSLKRYLRAKPSGTVIRTEMWEDLEVRLGTELPTDFKEFCQYYGAGYLGDEALIPLLPVKAPIYSMEGALANSRPLIEQYRREGIIPSKLGVFPEPGGLLQWADSGSGDMWFWNTSGRPDEWSIVAVPHGYDEGSYAYDCGMSDYLANLLSFQYSDDFSLELAAADEIRVYTPVQVPEKV